MWNAKGGIRRLLTSAFRTRSGTQVHLPTSEFLIIAIILFASNLIAQSPAATSGGSEARFPPKPPRGSLPLNPSNRGYHPSHPVGGKSWSERIVAVVGEEIIFASELDAAVNFLKTMPGTEHLPESLLRKEALKNMIKEKLLLSEAQRETIVVSRSEVEPELDKAWENLLARFPSEEDFREALKKENLTEKELRDRYYEEIRKKMLGQKLLQKKGLLNVFVSPLEVKRFYEENKDSVALRPGRVSLAHIFLLITPSEENEKKAQEKISEIYDILLRGADFEEVAKSFSEDEKTAKIGGYLGKLKRGTLQPDIEKYLFSLKEGEISQPFRSPLGYQILKCEKRRGDIIEGRHILIKVVTTREDILRQKRFAKGLRDRILKGESFDSLAKTYSQDPETKEKGGYIGEFYISQLFSPFREVAEKLKAGDISEPVYSVPSGEGKGVETDIRGIHLIKVLDKEEEKILPFEEMQDEIRNFLMEKKVAERLEEYISKIAERTYIKEY